MRIPAGIKLFLIFFWMCLIRRSARNCFRRKTVSFPRRQRILSDRTSSTISSCTICCVWRTSRWKFTVWRNLRLPVFTMIQQSWSGWKPSTGDFLHSSLSVPACRTDRRSEALRFPREAICACQVMQAWNSGENSLTGCNPSHEIPALLLVLAIDAVNCSDDKH